MSSETMPDYSGISAATSQFARRPPRRELPKRIFDVVLSTAGLIAISPLLFVTAICVKLDSPGPVWYRGLRVGRHGKPFRMFKFRSMVLDADRRGGSETAADDARITRVGSVLRRWKLDELPQLLNVVTGDMSLVGPRPQALDDAASYTTEQRAIFQVRPGITDLAAIKFRWEEELLRGSADPRKTYYERIRPQEIELSLAYVRKNSFLGDCEILFRTLGALVRRPDPPLE